MCVHSGPAAAVPVDQTYRYDGADRHVGIDAGANHVTYERDPLDRLVGRIAATPLFSMHDGMDDSADFMTDITEQLSSVI